MSSNLSATKIKVQEILAANLNGVELTKHGGFTLRHGSTRTFIECTESPDGSSTYVRVEVPLLFNVRPTPELFEFIAYNSAKYLFGTLCLRAPDEDGDTMIVFEHSLLADYLDEEELMRVVGGLAGVGDDIDDELQKKFGGSRFHEDDD